MVSVAVIGAGIVGVTTAYELLKAGHQVCVIEAHGQPAMETSFANGGQLSASNAEVWNSRTTVAKAATWLFQRDAPLMLSLKPDLAKYRWLLSFLRHIPDFERSTLANLETALRARVRLLEIAAAERIDFDHERRGILHVYRTPRSYARALRTNELLRRAGLERFAVDAAEMLRLEPRLQGSFVGGLYTPEDSSGDIHKFTNALADRCAALGATFRFGQRIANIGRAADTPVLTIRHADGTDGGRLDCEAVVVCAGAYSARLAATAGDYVPIYPVKGYSITVSLDSTAARNAAPWVSLLDEEAKIVVSRLGATRLRIAGTAEIAGWDKAIPAQRIATLTAWVGRCIPDLPTGDVTPWVGLRPMSPSMTPIVRRGCQPGVYYNTGHGHLGWTLATATAETVAQLIGSDLKPRERTVS